ncbi:hypothetical protein [Levilactobacillus sp. HBUAS67488]|uniref:hypothetical protein n=1 Tax=Levilactobacillus sp. HBUAS67488 TaxID=3109361 RepID=UPI002FF125ED
MSEPNLGSAGAFKAGGLPVLNGRLGNAASWRLQAKAKTASSGLAWSFPSVPAQIWRTVRRPV